MSDDSYFDALLGRLRTGDEAAATQLFERFAHRLVELARSRLDRRLQPKLDPEDVVQSVFRSFFLRMHEGEFELANWDSLWGLMVVITLRKCGRKVKYFRELRRDYRREIATAENDEATSSWAGIAREPTPDEAAVLAETVEAVMAGLTLIQRRILELRLQGYSAAEISAQVERSEHTVNWVLKRIRKGLQRLRDEEGL